MACEQNLYQNVEGLSKHIEAGAVWYYSMWISSDTRGRIGNNSQYKHTGLATNSYPKAYGTLVAKPVRSEEHTSELQSHLNLVCRLLLEKKKKRQQEVTIVYFDVRATPLSASHNQ